jgi:hypothetical protein
VPIVSFPNIQQDDATTEENFSKIDQANGSEHESETVSQNDEDCTENNGDSSEHSPQATNPKVQ